MRWSRSDRRSTADPAGRGSSLIIGRALAVGTLPALALATCTLAVHRGLLTTAVVLSSLYPVIPVVLGIVVLKERPTMTRIIGFAGAAAAATDHRRVNPGR